MFIKRLELFGFKSFAQRTKLDFEAGVTAIVGPNGCGKCVDGETRVLLADGRREKISRLVNWAVENSKKVNILDDGYCAYADSNNQLKVFSLNPHTLKIETKPILALIKRKSPQFLLRIKTKTGKTVTTTHYHPFFSIRDGEVFCLKAEQLREKIKIALPRQLRTSSCNNALDVQEILQSFSKEDLVYIPYSEELSNYIKTLAGYTGGLKRLAQEAEVNHSQIRSIGDGQALNAAVFSKLLNKKTLSNLPEIVNEIKSKGRGVIRLPYQLDRDLARFLGYVISEGRNTNSYQIWFVNNDEALINDFTSCTQKVFKAEAKVFSYNKNKGTKDVLVFSRALCRFLARVFGIGIGEGSRYKRVPRQLFSASNDIVSSFLSALFEGDGYICVDKQAQGRKNHVYIEYSTASQKLAEDIVSLLLRFGVQGVIREKLKVATNSKIGIKRKYYSVYIYGISNVKRIAQQLRFIGKKRHALELIKRMDYIGNPNLDLIPQVNRLIKLLAQEAQIKIKKLRKISPKLAAYYENRCEPSREGLSEALCVIEEHGQISGLARLLLNHLQKLARSDIYWDEIIEIERVEAPEWVYDLTVEDNHNFVANNIVVHNSNLADSLKWVLGEQSIRSMRGSKMEDVIFHGAEDVPAVGLAEVSLTISNDDNALPLDYEEITITRRIFRSGESEYLLNKVPVRLKDILELLMDTGMGMRSYSLMEQGKVDQILSSSPEDRRNIFEEASGITKYKTKREEALRKLQRTQENLQRLSDIILEVKRQIKSIERQVNKAERYKEEFERLKEYELKVSRYQYGNLDKEKKILENEIKERENKEQALSSKMEAASEDLQKRSQDKSLLEEHISQLQAESYDVSAALKTAQNKVTLDEERIEELSRRGSDLTQQIEHLESRISEAKQQLTQAQGEIEEAQQKKQARLAYLAEQEEEINRLLTSVKDVQKETSEQRAREVEVITQQTQVKNELTKLGANLANLTARRRRLNVEAERTQAELNNIEERYKARVEELASLKEQLHQLTREFLQLKEQLALKLEQKQKSELRLEEINRQLATAVSRLNFLKEINKRYEGFSKGVKSILSAQDEQALKIKGGCGVVANLVEVLPKYQTAVEFALGEAAQAIVVENRPAASVAIDYLKSKDKGRARFICRDSLNLEGKRRRGTLNHKDILGAALDFIKVEPKYQKVMEYLLADTFIVQDLETAQRLLKDIRGLGVRLVTLTGEIVTPASIIAGTIPQNLQTALLGRQERIVQAEAELEQLRTEQARIEHGKAAQELEIKELNRHVQEQEPNLNRLKINSASKESERSSIEAERKRFDDELSVLSVEKEETKVEIEQLQNEQGQLNQQLEQQQATEKELQNKIQSSQAVIAEKNQQRQNILLQIAEAKAQLVGLDKEAEDARTRLKMVLNSETEQKAQYQLCQKEKEDIVEKVKQLNQEISELGLESQELEQRKLEVQQRLDQTSGKRQHLTRTIQDLEAGQRTNQRALDALREKRASLQVKSTELNYEQGSLKDKMQQNYQVDLETSLAQDLAAPQPAALDLEEIQRLKKRLEGMGPVNLVAIEENEQLQQRYTFLISQQEDLSNAQESLRKAIAQINYTARQKFAQTFAKVQQSFKEYFRILFGGGDAKLILLDENDILKSGIEIVVRPPGKKPQNISLLSGGEKALTAIALLFGIFKVKPSPFCILDEVDAPLDESNTDRFTHLLFEFIKTSQFIIITHNKKTVNMADIMYGITMEKSGISKIVSVRLSEKKEEKPPTSPELLEITDSN